MCGGFAVDGSCGPAVFLDEDVTTSECDHRLDSERHTTLEDDAVSAATIVAHIGFLVHIASDTVSHELAYYAVACTLAVVLYGERDIAHAFARDSLLDTEVHSSSSALLFFLVSSSRTIRSSEKSMKW